MALTPPSTERIKFFAKHLGVYGNGNSQRKRGIPSMQICANMWESNEATKSFEDEY
jgi:hypothetical protein